MAKANKKQVEELGQEASAPAPEVKKEVDPVVVADAQALVAQKEQELKDAKSALKDLIGASPVRRGPVGVGAFIKECIKEGMANADILVAVADKFPANHTNLNCINWYRNALKNWPDGKRPGKKASTQAEATATEETEQPSEEPEYSEE